MPTFADLFDTADDDSSTASKPTPTTFYSQADIPYQMRSRSHNMTLINKTKFFNNADYIISIIYKYSY